MHFVNDFEYLVLNSRIVFKYIHKQIFKYNEILTQYTYRKVTTKNYI